jgi:hypothetical protein
MRGWTGEELRRIGGSTELQVASTRPDGTLRPFVTIWVVRAGDDIYVRSAYGAAPRAGAARTGLTATFLTWTARRGPGTC